MARIEGVILPKDKRLEYVLTYIYGLGLMLSRDILEQAKAGGAVPNKKMPNKK